MKIKPLISIGATIILLSVSGIGLSAERLPAPFVILPQPQNVIMLKGLGLEQFNLKQLVIKGEFKRPVMGDILSRLTIGSKEGKGTLVLILDNNLSSLHSDCIRWQSGDFCKR
jgi:hypothetical protein